ncbi:unnamed protein product [Brassica rapa]|uniref:Uncharacterized protein n=2 Tax=Brassica TaxID=3705 RepID=A0A8D9LWR0_BRACM|nr:unnamed protein product [Brassica napus]CAG7889792.1 unnamed protein product [Brassica rapa]
MFHRCVTCVSYLSSKVVSITEAPDGLRFISCEEKHHCSVQVREWNQSSCSTKLEDVECPCSSCIWRRGGGIV